MGMLSDGVEVLAGRKKARWADRPWHYPPKLFLTAAFSGLVGGLVFLVVTLALR